jgi:ribonuclease P protein component
VVPGAQGSASGCSVDAALSPQGLRLLRGDRLRKRFEFGRVRDQGRRVYTESFVLMVRGSDDASAPARLGLTVSQKVGGAVRRNRVKRLVREVFRRERGLFPRGAEIVVIAKPGTTIDGFAAVRAQLAQAAPALAAALARAQRAQAKGAR